MNTKHNLKLIDGKFLPAEAGKVLFGLLSYKINYHQMELFSNEERFDKDLSNSIKRIEELKAVNSTLETILRLTSENKQLLKISCFIEITRLDAE